MKKSSGIWALVADSGKARIWSLQRHPPEFREILELDSPTRSSPSRDLISDASGRSHHVRGPGSHVREPRISAHELGENRFVEALLERMSRASRSGQFEALVLAADPRTLGFIRNRMGKNLGSKVILELNLDLTGLSDDRLEKRLRQALEWPPAR
jgi:protein required for attachment to host cells